ncbi:MAG: hypothetical protein V4673_14305 [Pseudomonadota bacterium]
MTDNRQHISRERVEGALLLLAEIIGQRSHADAAVLAPIYDRLEQELAAMDRNDVVARARRFVASRQPDQGKILA